MTVAHAVIEQGTPHAWESGRRWWDLAFGGSLILVVGLALGDPHLGAARLIGTVAMAGVFVVWYGVSGAKALRNKTSAARYMAGAAVLFAAMAALFPASGVMLYALCAQSFALLRLRWGIVSVVVLEVTAAVAQLANSGLSTSSLVSVATWFVPTLLMACLLGIFIHRVIAESAQRAVLISELHQAREELAAASHDAGVAQERERLAREIHDTLAQGFTSVVLLARASLVELAEGELGGTRRHLELMESTALDNLAEARSLIAARPPAPLADLSLPEALARLAHGLEGEFSTKVEVTGEPRPLGAKAEVAAYRVAQEAIANVYKHARATSLSLRLCYGARAAHLEISDDGCGFDLASGPGPPQPEGEVGDGRGGYGLAGMARRSEEVGGRFRVQTGPGRGTTVELRLAYSPSPESREADPTTAAPGPAFVAIPLAPPAQ